MRKLTTEEFSNRARGIHNGRYKYPAKYLGAGIPMSIICKLHGVFKQTPNAHLQGQGCPICAVKKVTDGSKVPIAEVLSRFEAVHKGVYGYSGVEYISMHSVVGINCPQHGEFFQTPHSHIKGRGCPICAKPKQQKRNIDRNHAIIRNFEKLAREQHGDIFDYSGTVYTHNQGEVALRCTIHNREIFQTARDHLDGYNPCPQCNHMKSKDEQAIADYLSIYTPILHRDRSLIGPKELDIYIPSANLAVEFHGMYYHSHFNAEDEKKDKLKSYNKYLQCAEKGVRLITIYQTEWENRQPQIKRLLKNAIGKTKGKLMARKCQVAPVANADAKIFYEQYHPQGGAGHGEHYGLYWKDKLVACMRFSLGTNDRGNTKNRDWTLARYATRVNVLGGASRLFKAFVKEQDPELIKSFSDNRYFSGGMYEQLGFEMVQDSVPDYQVWSNKLGLLPKTHYQRRVLQKRLIEHGKDEVFEHTTDPRTEKDMTYLMGAGRVYDCGKKKWVWTK